MIYEAKRLRQVRYALPFWYCHRAPIYTPLTNLKRPRCLSSDTNVAECNEAPHQSNKMEAQNCPEITYVGRKEISSQMFSSGQSGQLRRHATYTLQLSASV